MSEPPRAYPTAAAALVIGFEMVPEIAYYCSDGRMTMQDIGRAAGVTAIAAKRAVGAYLDRVEAGGVSAFLSDVIPNPKAVTRIEMARVVAEQLGIGSYGLAKRIDERRAARPPAPPTEQRVRAITHPYRRGDKGRSVKSQPGGSQLARLTCGCGQFHDIRFRELCASEQVDRKFIQVGWRIDPAVCPACQPKKQETNVKPTPAAIRSQVLMFQMLTDHFNVEQGAYSPGHSDESIAKAVGMAVETVRAIRVEGFGEIKEPAELTALANDLNALERLVAETIAPIQTEMDGMRTRIADLRRKFAA